jgi:hypothetical protein
LNFANLSQDILFEDPRSRALLDQVQRVARSQSPLLLTGPPGSGKEAIARLVHAHSPRAHRPFVTAHCGAISEKLFESIFFGHVRGAFAGAVSDHEGYLTEANGGTLFLDEIGDLPLAHQIKLLRALDGYAYRPVGGRRDLVADIRFVSATNRDLESMCRDGRFREDLWSRICHVHLVVPPLDERPADVRAIARLHATRHRPDDAEFVDAVLAAAMRLGNEQNPWPLGIRQIQAFVARADILGVADAEHGMRSEWQRRSQPAAVTSRPAILRPGDRQALAHLIVARLANRPGKPMRAIARAGALAELLLGAPRVTYTDLQRCLDVSDARTLRSNVAPLVDSGMLLDDGTHVTLVWPPMLVRYQHQRRGDWESVPPGAIPLARSGDRLRIDITVEVPLELQVFVVTHHRSGAEPRRFVDRKRIHAGQTKSVELALDEQPGFEQILLHLSWPAQRGVVSTPQEVELDAPRPHSLQRERARLLEQIGPGWVEEWLVQHLTS